MISRASTNKQRYYCEALCINERMKYVYNYIYECMQADQAKHSSFGFILDLDGHFYNLSTKV